MSAGAVGDFVGGGAVPDRRRGKLQGAQGFHLVVVDGEGFDVMAESAQEIGFGLKDLIFTAGLLIEVVADQDAHVPIPSALAARERGTRWGLGAGASCMVSGAFW